MASLFFFVSKKEAGALQPCQDYRDLNNGTIKNQYPLPLVTDLVDKLKTAHVFTKLDLRNGYNNIRIKDGDQWKAAFKTLRGLFEPTVMFFGLTNSPATFQAFMNNILKDFIDKGWQTHQLQTRQVLERLQEHDLYLKPEKCEFDVVKTLFLGLVITPGHVQMDPTKLAGIKDWEPPTTVKDRETERVNQEVEIYLCFFCAKEQTKWKDLLHFAEFAHNSQMHSITKQSPFYLTMGGEMNRGAQEAERGNLSALGHFCEKNEGKEWKAF
ncbi:reverse transcriptase-rnase h-integrase [Moniliophthora roreri MCA 2997]|uniref:Reverse transcriptase-rnase h-integrase n=1 Tax=Moniliophthora roreri (strain MCA 2997) TaxID=1381753 RepID=V2WRB5_MONRO|nr:reverse transcriptase-rnase h-integrase [Moniliophthora roreri MCA 2997]